MHTISHKKNQQRQAIARHTKEFLARGGKIQIIKQGARTTEASDFEEPQPKKLTFNFW